MKKEKLLALILIFVVAAGISVLIKNQRPAKDINLTADGYTILTSIDEGERTAARVTDKQQAEQINKTLSGKYKGRKHINTLDVKDYIYIVSPMYITDDYKKVDDYADTVYHEDDESGHVIYGEAIYIFDEKTIGYWQVENNNIWVGKKVGDEIDLDLLTANN